MADKDYKAFIVEGEAREPQVIDNISKVFLFFDYDAHQTNLGKSDDDNVINQMLESFDNETENGKLYISYPMVEALRDFEAGNDKVFIISAFPEFLVDYFGMRLWRTCVKHTKNQWGICNCK